MVKCRPSAAFSASSAAFSGMNRAIASSISRSRAAMPMRCANGATWASTNAAASWDNSIVASAIRRARHASRSPDCIRAQQRGRRYFSSTAAAISARPPSVERPIARANSAMQNSATSGAPSPARVRPVSPPGVIQVAASSIDSGGCCSAQVTAATIRSACARLAAAWLSRANTSTSREESRSPRSVSVVAVMSEFKHRAPTETDRDFPAVEGNSSTSIAGERLAQFDRRSWRERAGELALVGSCPLPGAARTLPVGCSARSRDAGSSVVKALVLLDTSLLAEPPGVARASPLHRGCRSYSATSSSDGTSRHRSDDAPWPSRMPGRIRLLLRASVAAVLDDHQAPSTPRPCATPSPAARTCCRQDRRSLLL